MTKSRLCKAAMLFAALFLLPMLSMAEGSYKLNMNPKNASANAKRAYLHYTSSWKKAGREMQTTLMVIARKDETICFGSSNATKSTKYGCNISIVRQSTGTEWKYNVTKSTNNRGTVNSTNCIGYINTRTKEKNGPRYGINASQSPDNYYIPLTFTVPEDGIYEFRFYSQSEATGGYGTASNWNDNISECNTVTGAWDITVFGIDKQKPIDGRVFFYAAALDLAENGANLNWFADLYILTKDGYVYNFLPNGMDPRAFQFYSNNVGLIDGTSNQTLYKHGITSASSSSPNLDTNPLMGNVTFPQPDWQNDQTVVTHAIFLNYPDTVTQIGSGKGISQIMSKFPTKPKEFAKATDGSLTFIGNRSNKNDENGNPGNIGIANQGSGGMFTMNFDQQCTYELIINTNRDVDNFGNDVVVFDYRDKVIMNAASKGQNYIIWDGTDAQGNAVTKDADKYEVQLRVHGGEVHLPMFDVEGNPNGCILKLMNALATGSTSLNSNEQYAVYFDGGSYTTYNGTYVNVANRTPNPGTFTAGNPYYSNQSSGGALKFSYNANSLGNNSILDFWAYKTQEGDDYVKISEIAVDDADAIYNYGIIQGKVYFDNNQNQTWDASELGLAGITVTLWNADGSSQILDGNNEPFSAVTNGSGLFCMSAVPYPKGGNINYQIKYSSNSASGVAYNFTSGQNQTINVKQALTFAKNAGCYAGFDATIKTLTLTDKNGTSISGKKITEGDLVNVEIVVQNLNPTNAENVQVVFPTSISSSSTPTAVSGFPTAGTFNSGIWTVGTLASGSTATLKFTINPNAQGTYNYMARISCDNDAENDEKSVSFNVLALIGYNISFNANGGTGTIDAMTGSTTSSSITLPRGGFTRVGYTLQGWAQDANSNVKTWDLGGSYLFSTYSASNTLYAFWNPNTNTPYQVQHLGESLATAGTYTELFATAENKTGTTGTMTTEPASAKKTVTGFTFSEVQNVAIAGDGTSVVKYLYTRNSYNLNWVNDGNTTTISTKYQSNITAPSPTKTGYLLTWSTNADAVTGSVASTMPASDLTYYAIWTPLTYSISLSAEGGNLETSTIYENYNNGFYLTNTSGVVSNKMTVTTNAITVPTRTGYTFNGFYTAASGGSQYIDANGYITANASSTNFSANGALYAQWSVNNYDVVWYKNDGTSTTVESNSAAFGSSISAPANPSRTGYTFKGWSASNNGSTISSYGTVAVGGNKFYAIWSPNSYTITLNNQSATTAGTASITEVYGDSFSPSSITIPTKTGYNFGGYYTAANGGGTQCISATGVITVANTQFSANTTLYANWTVNEYTITLDRAGATNGTDVVYETYGSKYALTSNGTAVTSITVPTRTGYTFGGYYTAANGGGTQVIGTNGALPANTYFNASATLYAKWTANSYTISYSLNNGTAGSSAPTSALFDEVKNISNPTKTFTMAYNANSTGATIGKTTDSKAASFAGWTATGLASSALSGTASTNVTTSWTGTASTAQYFKNLASTNGASVALTATWTAPTFTLPSISKTGYSCKWNTAANGSGTNYEAGAAFTPSANDATNKTLYVIATANTYTISLNAQGGTQSVNTLYLTYATKFATTNGGAAVTTITVPTKTGYDFDGYYTATNGGGTKYIDATGKIVASNTATTANITLYANWTAKTYTITLDNQGATTAGTASLLLTYANAYSPASVTIPTRTGYTFGGYYTAINGGGTQYVNASGTILATSTTFTSNTTLYAKWTANSYTISYQPNGGSGTMAPSYMTYGVAGNLRANAFTRTGYTFSNWNTKENGSGTSYADKVLVSNLVSANNGSYTIYAQWSANTYAITLDNQSATTTGSATIYETFGSKFALTNGGAAMTASANAITVPTKTGYTFGGYYTEQDGEGTQFIGADGFLTTDASNTAFSEAGTLYAKWTANTYQVRYNANNGSGTMTNSSHTYNAAKTLSANSFTRTGYTFTGWNTAANGSGVNYTNSQSVTNLSNTNGAIVDLYAQWSANSYTITLNNASATTAGTQTIYLTFGKNYSLTDGGAAMTASANAITVPTKTGYIFGGYYTAANGAGTQYIDANGFITTNASNTNFSANGTLYAKWTAITYEVAYNGNGATNGTMTNSSHTYNVAKTLSANAFSRTGYTFAGWTANADGSGTNYTNSQSVTNLTTSNGNIVTIYAKWTANTYAITLDNQGATSAGTAAVYETYGNKFALTNGGAAMTASANAITVPTKTGYTFGGYYTAVNGNGTQMIDANGFITTTADNTAFSANGTLFAKWTVNNYTLTWDLNASHNGASASITSTTHTSGSIAYGTTILTPDVTNSGYELAGWSTSATGAVATISTMPANNVTYYAIWTAASGTPYTVKHYKMNLDGSTYTEANVETKYGTTGSTTAATAKTYEGFTAQSISQSTINGNGGTVITINYTRNQYTLTWNITNGGSATGSYTAAGSIYFDAPITAPTLVRAGYTGSWDNVISNMPATNTTFTSVWVANDNLYTVRHNLQNIDGTYTVDASSTQQLSGKTDAPTAAEAKSYTGFTSQTFSQKTITANANNDIDIFYNRNSYDLTWNLNGGTATNSYTSGSVVYGASITAPQLYKAGYSYSWDATPATTMPANALTYNAVWTAGATNYTVEHYFMQLDGTYPATATYSQTLSGLADAATVAVAKDTVGFTANFSQSTINGDGSTVVRIDYARNQHSLAWITTQGLVEASAYTEDGLVYYGTPLVAPTLNRNGFTYTWSPQVPATMPNSDATYTVVWEASDGIIYTVRHFTQELDGSYTLAESTTNTGKTGDLMEVIPNNYTGFTLNAFEAGTIAGDGSSVQDVFYSRNSYSVTWNIGDGIINLNMPYTHTSAMYQSPIVAPTLLRDGFDYTWAPEVNTMPANDISFTAIWSVKQYASVWLMNDGTDSVFFSKSLNFGDEIVAPATNPSRYGFTFAGWSHAADGDAETQFGTMTELGDTLFALWTENHLLISWTPNNGDITTTVELMRGEPIVAPANPSLDGYSFAGWSNSQNSNVAISDFGSATDTVEFFGLWNKNKYAITWAETETTSKVDSILFGEPIVAYTPTQAGFKFTGWATDNGTLVTNFGTMPSHNLTFVATWQQNTEINVDFTDDGICNLNCDIDGDGNPDLNIDTDGDGIADKNITDIKALIDFDAPNPFVTCENDDDLEISVTKSSALYNVNYSYTINGTADNSQNGITYTIPDSASAQGVIGITAQLGSSHLTKQIDYQVRKRFIRKMWDDVVSIVDVEHQFNNYVWMHNDKQVCTNAYYNEVGGLSGTYYLIATNKDGQTYYSCSMDFGPTIELTAYPNPTLNLVTIRGGNIEAGQSIKVFDANGQLLLQQTVDNNMQIDLSALPQGAYLIMVGNQSVNVVKQ
ncbi:MAG: InlB B-repeat-containing protein [Salinivirgaceae bacterium]|nr:InlB B-repeat-containing protein [Salinivirgaceae bacterium]